MKPQTAGTPQIEKMMTFRQSFRILDNLFLRHRDGNNFPALVMKLSIHPNIRYRRNIV